MSESELPVGEPSAEHPMTGEAAQADAAGDSAADREPELSALLAEPEAAQQAEAEAEVDHAGEPESPEAAEPGDDADADADPVIEFKTELRMLPGDWYVVHSYAGYENRVRTNLESRTQSLNMEDYIFQIEVPTHEVIEIKGGKRQQVQEKVLPGYILVR
ncbi:MAG TPA: transcription termination/antitermination NusG family protein, partial [Streptosporangiaceae bacterium]|nr:transcription termination/antitermination NusG family protein [Streptosporangiaceae bacterium]